MKAMNWSWYNYRGKERSLVQVELFLHRRRQWNADCKRRSDVCSCQRLELPWSRVHGAACQAAGEHPMDPTWPRSVDLLHNTVTSLWREWLQSTKHTATLCYFPQPLLRKRSELWDRSLLIPEKFLKSHKTRKVKSTGSWPPSYDHIPT